EYPRKAARGRESRGHAGEWRPVLGWQAEHLADDRQREGASKMSEQIDRATRAGRFARQAVERLVGQYREPRAKGLDAVPLKGLIYQAPQPAVVRRVAEQHVGGQRLERAGKAGGPRPHSRVAGR